MGGGWFEIPAEHPPFKRSNGYKPNFPTWRSVLGEEEGGGGDTFGRSPANPAIPQSQVTENTHSFEVPLWRCRQAFHAMRIVVSARQQSSLPGGRLNRRRCNRRGRCRNTQIVRRARQHGSSLGRGPNRARWNRSSASPTMYVEPSRTTTRGRLCRKPSHFHM